MPDPARRRAGSPAGDRDPPAGGRAGGALRARAAEDASPVRDVDGAAGRRPGTATDRVAGMMDR
ncbi:hypothetical protein [Micromonospora citrea]|uniref:hypothetical protein n=1 Tax=Micromonospora citrea TaxID=47855 RepID=UPI000B84FF41|nr:hypothetical protein [Micromonospora citrea]